VNLNTYTWVSTYIEKMITIKKLRTEIMVCDWLNAKLRR